MGNVCNKEHCLYCCSCCCPNEASHRESESSTNTLILNQFNSIYTLPPSHQNEGIVQIPQANSSTHNVHTVISIPNEQQVIQDGQLTDLNETAIDITSSPNPTYDPLGVSASSSSNLTYDLLGTFVNSSNQPTLNTNDNTQRQKPPGRSQQSFKFFKPDVQETIIGSEIKTISGNQEFNNWGNKLKNENNSTDFHKLRNDTQFLTVDINEGHFPSSSHNLTFHSHHEHRNSEPILKGIEALRFENTTISHGTQNITDIFNEHDETQVSSNESTSDVPVHTKTKGHADMSGEQYEIKMATLLYLLGLTNTRQFYLATNFQEAGAFDDIVFSYELPDARKYVYFIQLKHRKNQIKPPSLFERKDGFSLPKYWHSYNKIKTSSANVEFLGKLEDFNYIIYTNANVSYMKAECQEQKDTIIKTNGKIYNFANDYNDLKKYKDMLDDLNSISFDDRDRIISILRDFETRIINKELLYKIKLLKNKPTLNKIEFMRVELDSLGDLNDYGEFLEKVLLFAEQANETNLDTKIKKELESILFTTGKDTEEVFSYILQQMTTWWKNSCHFLTKSTPIWENVIKNCVAALNISPFSTIQFKKADLEIFRKSIPSDHSTIIIECSPAGSPLIHVKFLQTFGDNQMLVVSQKKFLNKQHHILSLIKSDWVKIIIVDLCSNDDKNNSEYSLTSQFLSELISLVYKIKNKLLMLLLPEGSPIVEYLLGRFGSNIERLQISCNITELDDHSQKQIMDQVIDFQGQQIRFGNLIGDDEKLRTQITDEIITPLISRKKQVRIGKRINDEIPYYVHRELKTNRSIRWRILFEKEENQLYIVSCINRVETSRLSTKMQNNVIFGGREQFCLKCVSNQNVHWLQTDGDVLRWMESQGDISPLIRNMVSRSTHLRHINNMKDVSDRILLLIAEPGMGKSTFVTHLALQTKQIAPTCWMVRLNLNDHTVLLDAVDVNTWNKEKSVEFLLLAANLNGKHERVLFKHSIFVTGNVVLLLDGFDEISPTHADKAFILLKNLKLTAVQKLWITSRPIMEQRLQQELSVPPYFLQSLDEESQRSMLHKFWEPKIKGSSDSNRLNDFIWKLLYCANESLGHKDFTRIPLHVVMLATAFENNLEKCNEKDVLDLPDKFDLLELYDKFVNEKLFIYYCEKIKADNTKASVQDIWNDLRQLFMENHMRAALLMLLTADQIKSLHDKTILDINATFLEKIQDGREKTGIIFQVTDGNPQFIHRTFAEFFMAQWFAKYFKYNKVLLEYVLFISNYGLMKNMFDRILAGKKMLHLAILNEDVHEVQQLCKLEDVNECDYGGRTPLHLVASQVQSSENFDIARYLLKAGASTSIADSVLEWTPLHYAWKVQSWKIAGELLKQLPPVEEISFLEQKFHGNLNEALFIATENDYVELLEVLNRNCKNINQCIETFMQQAIAHIAATTGSLKTMRWLQQNGCLFKQVDGQGKTPLHLAAGKNQLKIVQFLVEECNADIDTLDFAGETALDLANSEGAESTANYLQQNESTV